MRLGVGMKKYPIEASLRADTQPWIDQGKFDLPQRQGSVLSLESRESVITK